jgi:hypothetical protein
MSGGGLPRGEVSAIVRHLIAGCPLCIEEARLIWDLGREAGR